MSRGKISKKLQTQVRDRADCLCEYCHASEKWQYVQLTIDHVVPVLKGGDSVLDNLALACFHCNRRKSSHTLGIDPDSKAEIFLFNPRIHQWSDHFIWSVDGLSIVGLTPTGRATVSVLRLNRARIINIRAADRDIGRHPPKDDPVREA